MILYQKVDEYLQNKCSISDLFDYNSKYGDDEIPLSLLISTRKEIPYRYNDDQFVLLLKIYSGIIKEKITNIEIIKQWKLDSQRI